jgi:hypothetical protein
VLGTAALVAGLAWASIGAVPFEAERCPLDVEEGTSYESRCALGFALAAFAAMTARHRLRAAYVAVVLLVGGLAIWFVGPIAALVTAGVAAPAGIRLRPA